MGSTLEEHEAVLAMIKGGETFAEGASLLEMVGPSEADDLSVRHWFRTFINSSASPPERYEGTRSLGPVDIVLATALQRRSRVTRTTGSRR